MDSFARAQGAVVSHVQGRRIAGVKRDVAHGDEFARIFAVKQSNDDEAGG